MLCLLDTLLVGIFGEEARECQSGLRSAGRPHRLMMKEHKKTYVGAAVFFERLADDGWPEDAGLWPFDGFASPPIKGSDEPVQAARSRSLSQLVTSLVRWGSRMWHRVAMREE